MKNSISIFFILISFITIYDGIAQENGKAYFIESALGTFLDVKGGNASPKTPVWMWNKNGGAAQKWKLVSAGNGYFFIQSDLGTYLDIKEGKSTVRAEVWTWSLNRGNGQKWKFENAGDGFYYIRSALGTYLDIREGNPDMKAQVWMWSKNGGFGQKWKLVPTGDKQVLVSGSKITEGDYFIKSGLGHRYLDVKEANPNTKAQIWIWFFSGAPEQKWKIIPTGDNDNSYFIKSHLGRYLDIKGANSSPRSEVWTWYNNNSPGQKWFFEKANGQNNYYIKSKLGTYLDVKEGKKEAGTHVWMWSLNKGKGQQWELVRPIETIARSNPKFTTFDVSLNQFKFTNNDFMPDPFDGMPKVKNVLGGFKFKGLCGGMSYAANDYFLSKVEIPKTSNLPQPGSTLYQYIFDRQIESFKNIDKFAELSLNPNGVRDEEFFYWGLEGRFYTTLKSYIDRNKPVPLGLFNINNDLFKHHQVLAIGYDFGGYREGRHWDPNKDKVRIFIYDPNYNNEICVLVPNLKEKCYDEYRVLKEEGYRLRSINKKSNKWRTYFVDEKYQQKFPPRLGN